MTAIIEAANHLTMPGAIAVSVIAICAAAVFITIATRL